MNSSGTDGQTAISFPAPVRVTSMPLYLINATMSVVFFALMAMISEILMKREG
ncbi:MAG: hypothetical protein HY000_11675 [Planctomycetes bacterium]|nr:hypothetical protein [Planctomycetota bacterium]